LEIPLVTLPKKASDKVDKEVRMCEPKASCRASRPVTHFFGNPEGGRSLRLQAKTVPQAGSMLPETLLHQRLAVVVLLLTFLWRSKEK
jgi:hypothetical protein